MRDKYGRLLPDIYAHYWGGGNRRHLPGYKSLLAAIFCIDRKPQHKKEETKCSSF